MIFYATLRWTLKGLSAAVVHIVDLYECECVWLTLSAAFE